MPEPGFEEEMKKVDYWLSELRSLGVNPKRKRDMNNSNELHDLTDNIKQSLYQEYKTAYATA